MPLRSLLDYQAPAFQCLFGLSPIGPVERAVMDGFGDVSGLNLSRVFEVGDGAADFQDAIVDARGQAQARHRAFQHRFAFRINPAVAPTQTGRHRGVRVDSFGGQARVLVVLRVDDTLGNAG